MRQHIEEAQEVASKIRRQAQGVRAASVELRILSQELRARVKREANASRLHHDPAAPGPEDLGGKYIHDDIGQ